MLSCLFDQKNLPVSWWRCFKANSTIIFPLEYCAIMNCQTTGVHMCVSFGVCVCLCVSHSCSQCVCQEYHKLASVRAGIPQSAPVSRTWSEHSNFSCSAPAQQQNTVSEDTVICHGFSDKLLWSQTFLFSLKQHTSSKILCDQISNNVKVTPKKLYFWQKFKFIAFCLCAVWRNETCKPQIGLSPLIKRNSALSDGRY